MRSRSTLALAALPLLILLCAGLILPLLRAIPLSLLRWDDEQNYFTREPSFSAYQAFLSNHRGGIVLRNLGAAILSATLTLSVGLPILILARMNIKTSRLLSVAEAGLVLPFLFSQALRLHTLKLLLAEQGLLGGVYANVLPTETVQRYPLLYSELGVIVGLCFSYSALLLLPLIQMLKAVNDEVILAARDLGASNWRVGLLMLRHSRSGLVAGIILMTVVSWFSSLEYEILGTQPSILSMLKDLVGVEKYPEAFAFALVPFLIAVSGLAIVVIWCKPERLIGFGASDEY